MPLPEDDCDLGRPLNIIVILQFLLLSNEAVVETRSTFLGNNCVFLLRHNRGLHLSLLNVARQWRRNQDHSPQFESSVSSSYNTYLLT